MYNYNLIKIIWNVYIAILIHNLINVGVTRYLIK